MNIQTLNEYKENGLLTNQSHPTLPLLIWNYSTKVQYEQLWDEITLQCRALVTDLDGNVISRGFSKFFNIEENRHEPTDDFEVWEKLDGQYISAFWYNGEMVVNSRGSFTSPYAIEARRILDETYPKFKDHSQVGLTYCFELIGFEQIVVSYPQCDLICTGIFDVYGNEFNLRLSNALDLASINIVRRHNGLDWQNIKQLNWQNAEGFVVRFSNGSRCKIKFEDYVKLHRQMTNLSTVGIWEALMEGKPVSSILNDVPDEFFEKIHQYETELKAHYIFIETFVKNEIKQIPNLGYRKEIAQWIFNPLNELSGKEAIAFAMLDGKDYSKMIWKMIKPKFEKL